MKRYWRSLVCQHTCPDSRSFERMLHHLHGISCTIYMVWGERMNWIFPMHIFSQILTKKPEFFYNHKQLNDELRLSDVCVLVRLWVWFSRLWHGDIGDAFLRTIVSEICYNLESGDKWTCSHSHTFDCPCGLWKLDHPQNLYHTLSYHKNQSACPLLSFHSWQ